MRPTLVPQITLGNSRSEKTVLVSRSYSWSVTVNVTRTGPDVTATRIRAYHQSGVRPRLYTLFDKVQSLGLTRCPLGVPWLRRYSGSEKL
jgi:hypothetical protein